VPAHWFITEAPLAGEQVTVDHTCFNVEFFYDPANDAIHMIELNPRMSYHFSGLSEMIDGTSTHAVQLDLATGRRVDWRPHGGQYGVATSFAIRRFSDARVTRVPGDREIAALRERFPGATVKVLCAVGERLSHREQDVGSFRYALANLGGVDAADLDMRWDAAQAFLPFEFAG
jgi:hypothetical protein